MKFVIDPRRQNSRNSLSLKIPVNWEEAVALPSLVEDDPLINRNITTGHVAARALIECKTYRLRGHFEGDPKGGGVYRSEAEMAEWQKRRAQQH